MMQDEGHTKDEVASIGPYRQSFFYYLGAVLKQLNVVSLCSYLLTVHGNLTV